MLQFGVREPGRAYGDRPAVFGLAERDGKVALVRIEAPGHPTWFDLPGGAIEAGEDEPAALIREFGEETGLVIAVGVQVARAGQYFLNTDGTPFNNLAGFYAVEATGEDARLKIEDDHTLVWLEPQEALRRLRHPAHAWGLTAWLRR